MSMKPIISGGVLFEIEPKRYEELVAKEERLRLLEEAITKRCGYSNIDELKDIFNLKKEVTENEN